MKRLSRRTESRLPPVRMFIEDVEAIVAKLQATMDVQLEYDGYSFDSVTELRSAVTRPHIDHLAITAQSKSRGSGDASIRIEPDGVWLHCWCDDNDAVSAVAEQLRSNARWFSWRPERGYWWYGLRALMIMFLAWTVGGTIVAVGGIRPLPLVLAVLAFVAIFGLLGSSSKPLVGATRIQLTSGLSAMSFWERNRDEVLVGAISSLVAGLVGFLLGRVIP